MSDAPRQTGRNWVYVGVLTLLGLVLIWWAGEQFTEIRLRFGSEFRFPAGRLLVYLFTLVAAGIVFGQAASPQRESDPGARSALAGWSIVPLLMIVMFYWTFVWPPGLPWVTGWFLLFVTNSVTIVASCLVFGFFVSRLVATVKRRPAEE